MFFVNDMKLRTKKKNNLIFESVLFYSVYSRNEKDNNSDKTEYNQSVSLLLFVFIAVV